MPRPLLIAITIFVLCLSLGACSKTPPPRAANADALCPDCNVVLISMDTVRADHLGLYGYKRRTSPNVDALGARSLVFENAISQSAWTLPAHGSIMTGLYGGRLGVLRYPATRKLPDAPTLAETFQQRGYATAAFTGGGFVSAHFGFDRGFDVYSSKGRRFDNNLKDALAWLKKNRDNPFFLFLHGYDAHRPYVSAPADRRAVGFKSKSAGDARGFCGRGMRKRPPNLDVIVRHYDAAIHHGDRQVGLLIKSLKKMRLLKRTVVLLTSDHGEEFFEHGHCDHVRFLYQELIHVPYVVYVPGLAERGRRMKQVIPASISVAPTLLAIVGMDPSLPGVSLEPILRGDKNLLDAVYSETDSPVGTLGSRGETIAMTTNRDKLIEYLDEGSSEGYDLIADPGEQRILPESHRVYSRRSALRSWKASLRPLPKRRSQDSGTRIGPPRQRRQRKRSFPKAQRGAEERPSQTTDETPMRLPDKLKDSLRSLGYLE